MTPREAIRLASRRLEAAGVPDPLYDAAALLAHVTGRNALTLRMETDHSLTPEQTDAYEALLARRVSRIPLQHLLGSAWFFGRPFDVSEDVLIPRPETEMLVRRGLALIPSFPAPVSVLDLCTGSGCVAISLQLEADADIRVTASDISPAALRMAQANAEKLGAHGVRFLEGDLLSPLQDGERFDLILSNPPYIPTKVCGELQPEVRHDPLSALDGGADGLDIIRRILCGAPDCLLPGGTLLMEIGFDQGAAVSDLIARSGLLSPAVIWRDEAGLDRVIETRYLPEGVV